MTSVEENVLVVDMEASVGEQRAGDTQPSEMAAPEASTSSRKRQQDSDNQASCSTSQPSCSRDNVAENGNEANDEEPAPTSSATNDLRAGPIKRRRNEQEPEEEEVVSMISLSGSALLAQTITDIQKKEDNGKEKRHIEQMNVLHDLESLVAEGMDRRMKSMIEFLKVAHSVREDTRENIHQQKIAFLRSFHEMGEEEKELRYKEQIDNLIASHTPGTLAKFQNYNADVQTVFQNTEESRELEIYRKNFERVRHFFLKDT